MLANDWSDSDLLAYLKRRRVAVGCGWLSNPGLVFSGTPGLTVGRIQREAKLGAFVARRLADQPPDWDALARVEDVRKQVAMEKAYVLRWRRAPRPRCTNHQRGCDLFFG